MKPQVPRQGAIVSVYRCARRVYSEGAGESSDRSYGSAIAFGILGAIWTDAPPENFAEGTRPGLGQDWNDSIVAPHLIVY